MVERLLIYRLGSIGDTVVALPVFHMLARVFATAERRVLTNFPVNSDAAPLQSVIGESRLVHGYFRYRLRTRSPAALNQLRREIAAWRPDLAVWLNAPRKGAGLIRDRAFLGLCGIPRIEGAPTERDLRQHRGPDPDGKWESEAKRLARCVAEIGDAAPDDPTNWSLLPTDAEKTEAARLLSAWPGRDDFIAFSAGAKIAVKDWGADRWRSVLAALAGTHPELGLVLIGGRNDAKRSGAISSVWRGPVLDLCGSAAPRVAALVIGAARLFLGNDSGPMHLAASAGTPAVCVFSNRAKPGIWFPFGDGHCIFYPGLGWTGGAPRTADGEANLLMIPPTQVIAAAEEVLAR